MPYKARENIITPLVLARIQSIDARFTRGNCLLVPAFDDPPMEFSDLQVQLKYPAVTPLGIPGGSYLQHLDFEIAVFKKMQADSRARWERALYELNEVALLVRAKLTAYSAGGYLQIPLYDSQQTMTARPFVNRQGETVKEVLWTAFRLWGRTCCNTPEFVAEAGV